MEHLIYKDNRGASQADAHYLEYGHKIVVTSEWNTKGKNLEKLKHYKCKRLNSGSNVMRGESINICIDESCPCHQPSEKEVWEKDYDRLPQGGMTTKEFIRSLLASQRAEIVGRIEGLKEMYPPRTVKTEHDRELWLEFVQRRITSIDDIIAKINPQPCPECGSYDGHQNSCIKCE